MRKLYLLLTFLVCTVGMLAQDVANTLDRHNFLYAGQSKRMRMFIVKDGQVSWAYENKQGRGEISDAVLMTDGHVLIAHQYGITR